MRLTLCALAAAAAIGLAPTADAQIRCEGGQLVLPGDDVGPYECSGVDLHARMSPADFGLSEADAVNGLYHNDIWGWTDDASGREFALVGNPDGTRFVEVTDPNNPVYLGVLPTATVPSLWRDVKTLGHFAVVSSEAPGHGIQVFDLRRLLVVPDAPAEFYADARYTGVGKAHNIVVDDENMFGYAVGANQGGFECNAGGLHMIDMRDPLAPQFAGCFDDDGYTHDAQCVVYNGPDRDHQGKQICVASNEDTVTIVDVTDKANPVQLARAEYPNPAYTHQGWFTEDQRYFVANDELDEQRGLVPSQRSLAFDLTDLDNPDYLFAYDSGLPVIDHNLYILNGLSFQSNYDAGLRVVDVSDIAGGALREVGFFDTYPQGQEVQFEGQWSNYPYFPSGTLVANDIVNGLFVLRPNMAELTAARGATAEPTEAEGDGVASRGWVDEAGKADGAGDE